MARRWRPDSSARRRETATPLPLTRLRSTLSPPQLGLDNVLTIYDVQEPPAATRVGRFGGALHRATSAAATLRSSAHASAPASAANSERQGCTAEELRGLVSLEAAAELIEANFHRAARKKPSLERGNGGGSSSSISFRKRACCQRWKPVGSRRQKWQVGSRGMP